MFGDHGDLCVLLVHFVLSHLIHFIVGEGTSATIDVTVGVSIFVTSHLFLFGAYVSLHSPWQHVLLGMGGLKFHSLIFPLKRFSILQKNLLRSLNLIHNWQVSPQLSSQIRTWYSKVKRCSDNSDTPPPQKKKKKESQRKHTDKKTTSPTQLISLPSNLCL